MTRYPQLAALVLGPMCFFGANECFADADYKVVTIIDAAALNAVAQAAPADRGAHRIQKARSGTIPGGLFFCAHATLVT